ncbi:ATP-binding cassette domain-containing protein [Carnobacterium viridans]|uniref:ABC-2 type transport system ATP-binding protein n=1 Tax=Carnobacterium viridans TaxID=174587 RepID=A0A1H0ZKF1_9LACT|nr:ATP-binding cassette domain-containing protein [Carnobacterium viridans]UDE94580.1 ATP-binding cassette domain-containing protein [Carnobacterium viridans]SDQ27958.1 ABC-2 type transport system ATP-binding protein [Carnobacterium viridans]
MTTSVEVLSIEKNYGRKEVLKNFSLSVEKGEVYVLLGKNGAGKSTLFKILTGLSKATNGEIIILNESKDLEKVKTKIGSNINEPVFYEHLSAHENLRIHCEYMGVSNNQISEWLKTVGLTIDNDRPVKEYSLGMRQRLVLARCLVHNPELLIIDEPLNGLDPRGIKQFRELIEEISLLGKTIIMSSHILTEVESVATRIGVIYDGQLVLDERKQDLVAKYQDGLENFLINKMEGVN